MTMFPPFPTEHDIDASENHAIEIIGITQNEIDELCRLVRH